MAKIIPFKALRPSQDKAHLVAAMPANVANGSEIQAKLAENPFTFLHVLNPDFEDGVRTEPGSKERMLKMKSKFHEFIDDNVFLRDQTPGYYVYRQVNGKMVYTGIIACTSINDYIDGVIKIHEQTLAAREEKLKDYLDVCGFNSEPVLFCYPNDEIIDQELAKVVDTKPDYDFVGANFARHMLWVVDDERAVKLIADRFEKMQAIYLADGHHRSSSSTLLGNQRRSENKNYTGDEAFNYYMGIFLSDNQLKIFDYNRVVKDLNGLSFDEFIEKLSEKFTVTEIHADDYKSDKKHTISMYIDEKWFSLQVKEGTFNQDDPVESLDASILTAHILTPILGINDLRRDKRIGFVPGIRGAKELKRQVDAGEARVAFGLYPVAMDHLKWVADTGNIMPPKSTWVEPKLCTGLVIFPLDE